MDRTIDVNVPLSLRRLRIDDDNRYTIAGPQALLVSNDPYELSDIAGAGRRFRLDRGVLGVVAVSVDSARQAIGLLRRTRQDGVTALIHDEVIVDNEEPESLFACGHISVLWSGGAVRTGDGESRQQRAPIGESQESMRLRIDKMIEHASGGGETATVVRAGRKPKYRPGANHGGPPLLWDNRSFNSEAPHHTSSSEGSSRAAACCSRYQIFSECGLRLSGVAT